MTREYGFALIGCGGISKTHIRAIHSLEHGKLVAVSDVSERSARATGEVEGVDWYTDIDAMLQRSDIDIVNIVTPSGTHGDLIIAAAKAGKHVIVEKPLDVTIEKAEMAVAACQEAGVKLSVISQHLFDEATRHLMSAIQEGKLGRLFQGMVNVHWYRAQSYFDRSPVAGTLAMDGGGAFMIQAYHMIDVLQNLMGPVKRVYAKTQIATHQNIEVEDSAVATVEFVNGAIGTVSATTSAYPGFKTRVEVFGAEGSGVIENDVLTHLYVKDGPASESTFGGNAPNLAEGLDTAYGEKRPVGYAHRRQFEDLISSIELNKEPVVNGHDAIQTLKLILAMYQSARTGVAVDV